MPVDTYSNRHKYFTYLHVNASWTHVFACALHLFFSLFLIQFQIYKDPSFLCRYICQIVVNSKIMINFYCIFNIFTVTSPQSLQKGKITDLVFFINHYESPCTFMLKSRIWKKVYSRFKWSIEIRWPLDWILTLNFFAGTHLDSTNIIHYIGPQPPNWHFHRKSKFLKHCVCFFQIKNFFNLAKKEYKLGLSWAKLSSSWDWAWLQLNLHWIARQLVLLYSWSRPTFHLNHFAQTLNSWS